MKKRDMKKREVRVFRRRPGGGMKLVGKITPTDGRAQPVRLSAVAMGDVYEIRRLAASGGAAARALVGGLVYPRPGRG